MAERLPTIDELTQDENFKKLSLDDKRLNLDRYFNDAAKVDPNINKIRGIATTVVGLEHEADRETPIIANSIKKQIPIYVEAFQNAQKGMPKEEVLNDFNGKIETIKKEQNIENLRRNANLDLAKEYEDLGTFDVGGIMRKAANTTFTEDPDKERRKDIESISGLNPQQLSDLAKERKVIEGNSEAPAGVDSQGNIYPNITKLLTDKESVRKNIESLDVPENAKKRALAGLDSLEERAVNGVAAELDFAGNSKGMIGNQIEKRARELTDPESPNTVQTQSIPPENMLQAKREVIKNAIEKESDKGFIQRGLASAKLDALGALNLATGDNGYVDAQRKLEGKGRELANPSKASAVGENLVRLLPQILATRGVGGAASGTAEGIASAFTTAERAASVGTKAAETAAIGFGGLQSASSAVEQTRQAGGTPEEQFQSGLLGFLTTVGVTAGFNKMGEGGLEDFSKHVVQSKPALVAALARAGFGEGAEETADQILNSFTSGAVFNPNAKIEDVAKEGLEAGLYGFIFGAGSHVGSVKVDPTAPTHTQTNSELEQRANANHPEENLPQITATGTDVTAPVVDRATLEQQRDALPPGTPERAAIEEQLAQLPPVDEVMPPAEENVPADNAQQNPNLPNPPDENQNAELTPKQNSPEPTTPPANETKNRSQEDSNREKEKASGEEVTTPSIPNTNPPVNENVGITKAITAADRKAFGYDAATPRESVPNAVTIERAKAALEATTAHEADPSTDAPSQRTGKALINHLNDNPDLQASPVEKALILHEKVRSQAEVERAEKSGANLPADATAKEREDAAGRLANADMHRLAVLEAAERTGSLSGAALQAQKLLVNKSFELQPLLDRALIAKNRGSETKQTLTSEEKADIKKQHDELKETVKQRDAEIEQLQNKQRQMEEDAHVEYLERQAGIKKKSPAKAARDADLDKKIREARERLRKSLGQTNSGVDPTILKDLGIIGVSYLRKGARNLSDFTKALVKEFGEKYRPHAEEIYKESRNALKGPKSPEELLALVDKNKEIPKRLIYNMVKGYIDLGEKDAVTKVHEQIKTVWPGTTRDMVSDAFTGYGNVKVPSLDQTTKNLNEYRRYEKLLRTRDDLLAGKEPLTAKAKKEKSDHVAALEKEIKTLRPKPDRKVAVRDSLTAVKTRLQNETKVYEKAVKDHEAIPPKSRSVQYDAEATQLKQRRNEAKAAYDKIFTDPNLKENQKIKQTIKLLDKQIAEEDKMQKEGILKKPSSKKTSSLFTPEISDRQNELATKRQLREDAYNALYPKKTSEQRAFENATKSVKESISNYEEILKSGTLPQKEQRALKFTPTKELGILWDTRNRLKTAVNELRKSQGPQTSPAEIARKRALAAAEKTIKDLERRISTKDFSVKQKTDLAGNNPDVVAARALRDSLRKTYSELEKVSPIAKARSEDRQANSIQKRIADYERRIKENDFVKAVRPDPVITDRIAKLQFEEAQAKLELEKTFNEYKLKNASFSKKLWRGTKAGLGVLKFIKLAGDAGVVLRNAGPSTLTRFLKGVVTLNPKMAVEILGKAAKAGFDFTGRQEHEIYQGIMNAPESKYYKQGELKFLNPSDERVGIEEGLPDIDVVGAIAKSSTLGTLGLNKIAKLSLALERANRTYTNLARYDTFKTWIDSAGTKPLTKEEIKQYAYMANVSTGRGTLGASSKFDKSVPFLNDTIALSARWSLSRLQLAAGAGLYKGTARTRMRIARDVYILPTVARVLLLAATKAAFPDEWEDKLQEFIPGFKPQDKESFGNIKINGTKVDLSSGINPFMSLIAANVKNIAGERDKNIGQKNINYFLNRSNPIVAAAVRTFILKQNFDHEPIGWKNAAEEWLVPIIASDTKQIFEKHGPEGVILWLEAFAGAGVQTKEYKPKVRQKKEKLSFR